jgi:DNA-binding response OmpR family regulator
MNGQGTILVVDDDQELREGLQVVLRQHGYETIEARNGIEAQEVIDSRRPDLVILDMMMPRLGGFPVLERYWGKTDAPAFIMITANEGKRHKAYAEYVGVVDYIRKPFAMERLLEGVESCLGRKAARPSGRC